MRNISIPTPSTLLRPLTRPLITYTNAPCDLWRGRKWTLHKRRIAAPMGKYMKTLHAVTYADTATTSDWVDWYADDDIFNHRVDNLIRIPKRDALLRRGGTVVWSEVLNRWTVWHGFALLAAVSRKREAQEVAEEAERDREENEKRSEKLAEKTLSE